MLQLIITFGVIASSLQSVIYTNLFGPTREGRRSVLAMQQQRHNILSARTPSLDAGMQSQPSHYGQLDSPSQQPFAVPQYTGPPYNIPQYTSSQNSVSQNTIPQYTSPQYASAQFTSPFASQPFTNQPFTSQQVPNQQQLNLPLGSQQLRQPQLPLASQQQLQAFSSVPVTGPFPQPAFSLQQQQLPQNALFSPQNPQQQHAPLGQQSASANSFSQQFNGVGQQAGRSASYPNNPPPNMGPDQRHTQQTYETPAQMARQPRSPMQASDRPFGSRSELEASMNYPDSII